MDSMESKYDGHMWTKPRTSRHSFEGAVRISYCLGALTCDNVSCACVKKTGYPNVRSFKGSALNKCLVQQKIENTSSVVCFYCSLPAYWYDSCDVVVYCVMPKDVTMTRLLIHKGKHKHPVQMGSSKLAQDKVREGVQKILAGNRTATPREVQMDIAKTVFLEAFTTTKKFTADTIDETQLCAQLEELIPLISSQS